MSEPKPDPSTPAETKFAPRFEQRRRFFARATPEGYAEEWAKILEQPAPEKAAHEDSMLEFRIADLPLAIASRWVKAVSPPLTVCPVPHRDNTAFLGLVAYAGEVIPCCSLARILGAADSTHGTETRTIVLEQRVGVRWAFPVDAVLGVSTGTLHGKSTAGSGDGGQLDIEWSDYLFEDERGRRIDSLRPETLFLRLQRATA